MNTKSFLFDASVLIKEEVFSYLYNHVSESRKKKIDSYKVNKPKYTSLGAEVLLYYALSLFHIYLNQQTILYEEYGKPYFKDSDIHFNISHSYPYVLVSLSNQPVGSDIEEIKEHNQSIADKYFHNNEINQLHLSKTPLEDFTKLWTLKEANSKYLGVGLNKGLNQTDFSSKLQQDNFNQDNLNYLSKQYNNFYYSICSETQIDENLTIVSLNDIIQSYQHKSNDIHT